MLHSRVTFRKPKSDPVVSPFLQMFSRIFTIKFKFLISAHKASRSQACLILWSQYSSQLPHSHPCPALQTVSYAVLCRTPVPLHRLCLQPRIPPDSPNLHTYFTISLIPTHPSEYSSKSPLERKEIIHDIQLDPRVCPQPLSGLSAPVAPACISITVLSHSRMPVSFSYHVAGTMSPLASCLLSLALSYA